ncbi:sodium/hydrogen exchanger [Candidatus Protofrankia californiensis]|uniref:Sodium/hydrogen exchanger n=1 Tax=Candidatus Protofrankia californiensis TaxID=1839754 RepID=A0A1C3NXN2_9ACTN|nr:sodium/hydrogen exchanger [Candidatus Protofrankia californiensis]
MPSSSQQVMLLVDLVLITGAAALLGRVAALLGQPPVVGEMFAGILTGPAVIGIHASRALFPLDVQGYLAAFSDVGVALFMFQAGAEIERRSFDSSRRLIVVVSVSAYVVPFLLGVLLATTVLAGSAGNHPRSFRLFVGAALAVTAFPVLARILSDRNMLRTRIGQWSLGAAAANDVLAWTVLSALIAFAGSRANSGWRLLLVVPFGLAVLLVRRVLVWRDRREGGAEATGMAGLAVCGTLLCGAATEWVGLHFVFGAFAFGVIFPRRHREAIIKRLDSVSSLFLPAFFVVAGLQVDGGLPRGSSLPSLCAVIVTAVLGKFGGTFFAAWLCGTPVRDAGMLASLMNTRGLTELVILVVGLSLGLIDRHVYSLMVVAALVTTAMTAPLLGLFERRAEPVLPSRRDHRSTRAVEIE